MFTQTLILSLFLPLVITQMIVLTTKGPIRGQEKVLHGGMTSISFLGIPYAQPPLGHLRFQNPLSTDEWTQVITAANSRPSCLALDFLINSITGDENCLYLDIYTGQTTSSIEPLQSNQWPVLVIFQGISKLEVNSPQLLFKRILLVVVRYRLQVLGHLKQDQETTTPAQMDQIMALEWIHKNIIAFGGDPDQVTIIGEGQTGNDITALLFTPLAKGLFTGAGILSAPLGMIMTSSDDAANAKTYQTRVLASRVDCLQRLKYEMIKCLKKIEARDLIRYQTFNAFGPVLLKNLTCVSHVPFVIGITSQDGENYVKFGDDILKQMTRNYEKLKKGIEAFYGDKLVTSEMIFDSVFYGPAVEVAKKHAQHTSTFLYELRYKHPFTALQMILNGPNDALQSVDEHVIKANLITLWSHFVTKGQPSISDLPLWTSISSSKPSECYEIDVDLKSPPSCRRINQASFWNALHVLDDSITNITSQYMKYSPTTLEPSTGCVVAVTILTVMCITLFLVCLFIRHPQFHLQLASTFRNVNTRISTFCARRRVPQTEV